jgi:cytochrome c
MRKLICIISILLIWNACGSPGTTEENPDQANAATPEDEMIEAGKGVGEITEVKLNNPLNGNMVDRGKNIYEMKCAACHRLTDQRVVGPGWKGVTDKRQPEWIMNMTTNVDVMLEKDPAARELLKECLVRMPNQNLSIGDARDVLEFMYANDGQTVGSG